MKPRRCHLAGLTLIETMLAMGMMSALFVVAIFTVNKSVTLEKQLSSRADRVIDQCRLAERWRADGEAAVRFVAVTPRAIVIHDDAGERARYECVNGLVIRTDLSDANAATVKYRVGPAAFLAWDDTGRAWVEPTENAEPVGLKVMLADAHIAVTRQVPR